MTVYLGVSRTHSFLGLQPGEPNFWCVGGASKSAQPGDQVLLYFPVAASRLINGIGQVYTITSMSTFVQNSPCASRGLLHVDTEVVLTFEERVTAKNMKADPVVSKWPPLARYLQGTTFMVGPDFWPALRALIVAKDARADAVLAPA